MVMVAFRSTITPVLTVRGAAQAVAYYERAFGAEQIYCSTYPDGRIVSEMAYRTARGFGGRGSTRVVQHQPANAQRHYRSDQSVCSGSSTSSPSEPSPTGPWRSRR